jgi:uncharacterized membrane protein YfcA
LNGAIFIYVVAGVVAGLVSGLFGMGGGLAVVPMLVLALTLVGIGPDYLMHLSLGTSLCVMVLTSIYTTMLRGRSGDLEMDLLKALLLPVALGAIVGSLISDQLPGYLLRIFFICFVLYMTVRLLRRAMGRTSEPQTPKGASGTLPPSALSWGYGLISGVCGALLGIGVAAVMTPFLIRLGYRISTASALAAALAIVVGLAAGTGYILGGLDEVGLPANSLGYVYLPAFAGLVVGALAGSPLGIRLSHTLSERIQLRLFLLYLAAVLIVMATSTEPG